MKRGIIAVLAAVVVLAAVLIYADSGPRDGPQVLFKARLADPSLYQDGLFSDQNHMEQGSYELRFVPSGDSPRILDITILDGDEVLFSERFELEGTEQGTESARYFTWDYLGEKQLDLTEDREVTIWIDPNGNTLGSVTVMIVRPYSDTTKFVQGVSNP